MLSRLAFFMQKRNYTLKQIMEMSLPLRDNMPKPKPKPIPTPKPTCCILKCPKPNCIIKHKNEYRTRPYDFLYQLPNN